MPFFKDDKDTLTVDSVKQRKLVLLPLALIIILSFTISATAFYFDFQYFETDKLVYEIGESVNMVASLIADFSIEGYCFVSFAIVTDLGPAYADEYFIPPSPNARLINSSYLIHPDDTNPSIDGITAFALFNVEIYDSVTQGASDNIEFTITRGHLTVYPQTSMIVQANENTTIQLKVGSIHDSNITYPNEEVEITIKNSDSEIIMNENRTTNLDGSIDIDWNQSFGLPGIYDLTIVGFGNEDFLEFSKNLQVTVVPTLSNLDIVSAPDSVHCQSPNGANFDISTITVRHETSDFKPIDDSIVYWNSSFGSGLLDYIGEGKYSTSISFTVSPGLYSINVTAINSRYQITTLHILVEAIRNPLSYSLVENIGFVVQGNNITIEFQIDEIFNWNQQIPLEITDNYNEITQSIDTYSGIATSFTITAQNNLSIGSHNFTINVLSDYYYFLILPEFQVTILGELTLDITFESAYYGENMLLNISTWNYNGSIVELFNLSVYNTTDSLPFYIIQEANSSQLVSVTLPLWITPGVHEFRFEIMAPFYVPISIFKNVTILMRTNITIIIETSSQYNELNYWSNNLFSISLHQTIHLAQSFDRRLFYLTKPPQPYLLQHVKPL